MKTIGILGLGEVGQAIKQLAQNQYAIFTRDLDHDRITGEAIDILHICIPYSASFEKIAVQLIKAVRPKLVIINSTIKPGTTRAIHGQTKVPIAHTPIMGVHPHLAKYQTHFAKVVGAIDDSTFALVKKHWLTLGAPKIVKFDAPEDAELAKLLCTTYYGWNIVFNKIVKNLTEQTETNFDQVYTQFSQIYNDGYAAEMPHVRRPVLSYMDGPIGGHCVIPNLQILSEVFDEKAFAFMLEFNEKLADKK